MFWNQSSIFELIIDQLVIEPYTQNTQKTGLLFKQVEE